MPRRITLLIVTAAFVAGCGSGGGHFANVPRPPSPVNVSVYINDQRVSISPSSVGAGPVVFLVSNQASQAESMTILPAGVSAGQALADTGPISPQATAQITVDLKGGNYSVSTGPSGATEAAQNTPSGIAPASLHIGHQRPSASGQLMNP
ncbi:MAG TPA: hypothetical protein VE983_05885 [Solirubrobacteraceae bacterium]|nr:hypothetical protein [Solirubrobacteraceae bacterium]